MIRPSYLPATAALLALSFCAIARAPEAAPPQVPGVYHHATGPLRVTALLDGNVALSQQLLAGAAADRVAELLERGFVPGDAQGVQTAVNAFLVRAGDTLVLVDAGTGDCFGPGLGRVPENLRAAGYAPEQVDHVLLTHAHPDHMCGLRDAQGAAVYPNATVWLAQADADYWLDPASEAKAPEDSRATFAMARRAIAPYQAAGRVQRFVPGQPGLPLGAAALDTHGHTPGHVSYLFGEGGQGLLAWGDVLHFHAVQFAHPEVSIEFDSDRTAAIASRKRVLQQASGERWWVAGAHLPFPGLGHVRTEDGAYAWVPAEFSPLPDER
ncbi:MBL fold metallo-hydrolase [Pseudoxanthomonas broegbernensis]|uniref:MBL fold metallo-hydrolase n=1 Tax=Pseudoxanthomonas broegbernensis TaxID=83619 RepID=A0A7V8GNR3_9GAMM|nr:MBL fold metallo-hydrolase [Pseudoxanthomonas broegbernensis]KAF1687144.1 MBL fold metallo-hydrolase [Pseudoxanthomonas broegbernensis]MBB6065878.1 glyoxylase-like metal-dependent hydrolase (beta-lactamase superfamily II) [Pseudoxanthomonas broegbernensis]